MGTNECRIHLRDHEGSEAIMTFWVDDGETDPSGGAPAAIASALDAITDCQITDVTLVVTDEEDSGETDTGAYDCVTEKMRLEGKTESGAKWTCDIPAPDETYIQSDKRNFNQSNGDIAALITAAKALASGSGGDDLVSIDKVFRVRANKRKNQS